MTSYFAKLEPDEGGYIVVFPDLPEAITGGHDRSDALANARDALEVVLLAYAGEGKARPAPEAVDGHLVSVSARVAVKIAFIEAFLASGLSRVELARRLGKGENEVRRMLDPYHNTKLGSMEAGLRALGKHIVVSVEDAA